MSGSSAKPSPPDPWDTSRPLDPVNDSRDYRILEMHAYRNGWRIRFKDGRVINPEREKRPDWPDPRGKRPSSPA